MRSYERWISQGMSRRRILQILGAGAVGIGCGSSDDESPSGPPSQFEYGGDGGVAPFDPLVYNPVLWLESDFGVPTSNGLLSTWTNKNPLGVVPSLVASAAARPTFTLGAGVNGLPTIEALDHNAVMEPAVPTSLFAAGAGRTVYVVAQGTDTFGGHLYTFRRSGNLLAHSYMNSSVSWGTPLYWYHSSDGAAINHQLNPPPSISDVFCSTVSYVAGEQIHCHWHNGVRQYIQSQQGSDTPLSTADDGAAGFTLFNRIPTMAYGYGWKGKIYAILVFPGRHDAVTRDLIHAYLGLKYGIRFASTVQSLKKQAIFDGDSITRGVGASLPTTNYVSQTMALVGGSWDVGNFGVDGTTTVPVTRRGPRSVDIHYFAGRAKNIYVDACGTNDVRAGSNPNTVYDRITNRIAAAKATGWYVIRSTISGRIIGQNGWDAGMEANRRTVNNSIVTNTAGAHAIVDNRGVARVETPDTGSFVDGLHPTDLGASLMAPAFAARISAA